MRDSLLDHLCAYLSKEYVSQLKEIDGIDKVRATNFVSSKNINDYPVASWNDARNYITGSIDNWSCAEEARSKLIDWLRK